MSPGMYSIIHLLETMRLSAIKSPLIYPSSEVETVRGFISVKKYKSQGKAVEVTVNSKEEIS